MPSSITHNYFMQDVFDKLNDDISKKFDLIDAKTFAQGPDIFYFYNMCIGRKSKKYRDMGNYMHKHNTNDYFKNIITYIKENDLYDNARCMAFLYGSVCHFVLDSVVHPFVFYKTGVFKKGNVSTYKYSGLHQEMEYYLDAYMIFQNEKKEAKNYKMYNDILNNKVLSDDVINLINDVIYNTYGYEGLGNIYNKCVRDMKSFFKYFNYDHYGIKKCLYSLVDVITPRIFIRKKKFSFYLTHNSKRHYLNLEKNEWNHPCDLNEIYNYSFVELYIIAIDRACNIIKEINSILTNKNVDEEMIDELFHNCSYVTGKSCEDKKRMKYFEF